ncbi:MAG TPA: TetR family transcriptional regulator, partial [Clostridium sp.]|nr:TetR family transcriptional regulator [Clostridium sp.]
MFSKFLNLDMEKQDRILNAAMKEFAQKGFEKASTNEIVKEADISKGLLFHYFKDKKNLFLFLYDHCIDVSTNEFYKKINLDEKDFFIRLNQMCIIKFELLNKYPEMFRFIETAYMETSKNVKKELDERKEKLIKINSIKVFEG